MELCSQYGVAIGVFGVLHVLVGTMLFNHVGFVVIVLVRIQI